MICIPSLGIDQKLNPKQPDTSGTPNPPKKTPGVRAGFGLGAPDAAELLAEAEAATSGGIVSGGEAVGVGGGKSFLRPAKLGPCEMACNCLYSPQGNEDMYVYIYIKMRGFFGGSNFVS